MINLNYTALNNSENALNTQAYSASRTAQQSNASTKTVMQIAQAQVVLIHTQVPE